MTLQFFGAAGTVTGSNFLLNNEIMVDMGMFQGSTELEDLNYEPLGFNPKDVRSVLLTHAHLDHVGRMPMLMRQGFTGKVYMTAATREIAEVVLMDAAKIMAHDDKAVLYTGEDVARLLNQAKIVSYGEEIETGEFHAKFYDAGHILGSASIELSLPGGPKIAMSGDLGNSPEELVSPTEYIKSADIAVMESTYGDRNHPTENPDDVLVREITTIEKTGGVLLIPSFSVERTQVLLFKIDNFKAEGKIKADTPIYLDSPMGEKVTEIYRKYPELYNPSLREYLKKGDPFSFPGLNVIESYKESQRIYERGGGKVIIAGSGMMTGGRIMEHAAHYLPLPTTRLLIVGFQAEDTVGRALEEGAKNVKIYGEEVKVAATINALHSMSAHADQANLLKWLGEINGVKKVFLVHGENGPRKALAAKITKLGTQVSMPELAETHEI